MNFTSFQSTEGRNTKKALLDILLQSTVDGKSLSNEDIREEVDTFMFEVIMDKKKNFILTLSIFTPKGHDTTTSGICFTLYLISRHPNVQDKLFTEVQEVFENKNEPATYRWLKHLQIFNHALNLKYF